MLDDNFEKKKKVAMEIVDYARNGLFVRLRFMNMALFALGHECTDEIDLWQTDGKRMMFSPKCVIEKFRKEEKSVARAYLHMVLHCVFRHMFVGKMVDKERWGLACDIAVEAIANELDLPQIDVACTTKQNKVIAEFSSNIKVLTAEKIYRYLLVEIGDDKVEQLKKLFFVDDHTCWYQDKEKKSEDKQKENCADDKRQEETPNADQNEQIGKEGTSQYGENDDSQDDKNQSSNIAGTDLDINNQQFEQGAKGDSEKLEQFWEDVSQKMQMDLEKFSTSIGSQAGTLKSGLIEVNRERYDYTKFLKSFAVMGEVMKINDDEFDYVFYTYGLNLYKNMPLVEPLEYKDVKRVKEFVIAIDTSGSTEGDLVKKFLTKTYNILRSTESFFSKINVHIVQCDTEIQHIAKITNNAEFEEYIKNLRVYGMGGTDFRPVFRYVDDMIKGKHFVNLKGMIYFTDGYGTFPKNKPKYKTAFVFVSEQHNIPSVPPWAIKLVLDGDEIENI